jgi:hydroxyacylglutathione hydrolase
MKIKQLQVGLMGNYCYILIDEKRGLCVLIDPSWDMEKIEEEINKENVKVAYAVLTHGHFDHSRKLEKLVKKLKFPVYIEESDLHMLELDSSLVTTFSKDCILDEKGIKLQILHTPGHSKGSCCVLQGKNLFTGDTLFINECGRVDLPDSSPEDMRLSLLRLMDLDRDIKIYPGHNYSDKAYSTIGEENQNNPVVALAKKGRDYFIS